MIQLKDKVVWLTGASSGIGQALAYALNAEGAHLILSGRNEQALAQVSDHCDPQRGRTIVLPFDLEDLDQFPAMAEKAVSAFGRIDILVNNGGIGQFSPALETSIEVDEKLIRVNYLAQVALTKAVLPYMLKQHGGQMVVVSSLAGKIGTPGRTAYSASKHALHGFFDSLRTEVWREGIKVTLVCPGWVRTNFRSNALAGDGRPYGNRSSHKNAMSAVECARQILDAIVHEKQETYIGRTRFAVYAQRLWPGLFSRVLRRMNI